MIVFLYNFALYLFSPLWVPWMLFRTWRRKEKPRWGERFGLYPNISQSAPARVWVHAVSVGEVVAAIPILQELKKASPSMDVVLSVTTSSGHQTAREHLGKLFNHLVYAPIDLWPFPYLAMRRVRPGVLAVMETELWLNLLRAAKCVDARTLLLNGRISDRSYPRSHKMRWFYRSLMRYLDFALMQSEKDSQRIVTLGSRGAQVLGNSKFDQAQDGLEVDPGALRKELGIPLHAIVVVIGSTRGEEEEDFVLKACSDPRLTGVYFIHAPRHLERVNLLVDKAAVFFDSVGLRSKQESSQYLILDTYGELSRVYSVADVAIVGGGFGQHGGQNILQPLAHGKPILHGSHMQNFAEVATAANKAGCAWVCATSEELANHLVDLLQNEERRAKAGQASKSFIVSNLGASKRYAEAILQALGVSQRQAFETINLSPFAAK